MGPCATQMLGDYGAERDQDREDRHGRSLTHIAAGRSSRPAEPSVPQPQPQQAQHRSGPKSEAGKDIVRKLVAQADVMVNNFRSGVMERMGFGYEEMAKINRRIIHATGTGFGNEGPYAHKGGQDVLAQALTGLMHRRSTATDPLSVYPTTLADYSAGMHLVQAILFALLQRDRTGQGQKVYVSLYNSVIAMQMQEAAMKMADSEVNWAAMPLPGVFDTQDGALVLVGAFKANPLREICIALQIDDLSATRALQFQSAVREQGRITSRLPRAVCEQHAGRWLAGWRRRTCSAHRCVICVSPGGSSDAA